MRFWTELKWTRGDSADRVPRLDVGRNMAFRLWSLPVLVLLLGVACSSGGSDEVPLPDLTPFPADLQGRMHEIRDATADLRGLPINEEVEEGKLSRDALRSYWDEVGRSVSDEDIRKIEELTNIFRLLHMIDDERNYLELFLSFQSEAVIGFYLPDEGTLVLVEPGEQFGLRDELTLPHEYVHTLQDAWWNDPALEELQEQDETEYGTTISCVFEGDASLTSILYMSKVHGATWLEEMRAEAEPEEKSEEGIPPAFQRYFGFDYNECVLFVLAVFVDRGWAGIDALYEKLPSTTEQILHPEKYFASETSTDLPATDLAGRMGSGWERVELGRFGEFDVFNYLLTIGGEEESARKAAAGWGAGWIGFYNSGSGDAAVQMLHISLEWDGVGDFREFKTEYERGLQLVGSVGEFGMVSDAWIWQDDRGFGFAIWEQSAKRVDIVISTSAAGLDLARTSLLTGLASAE